MKTEFLRGYDKIASLAAPGYEDEEISGLLNEAQERLIKRRINPDGNKYKTGFQETEKRRKELDALLQSSKNDDGTIKTSVSANQNGKVDENGVIYNLPEDIWLPVLEWVVTDDTCNTIKDVIPTSDDEYLQIRKNPFKKPNSRKVIRLDSNRYSNIVRHEIVTDGNYNIVEYHVRYIKKPVSIDIENEIDCELNEMFHREIVEDAVSLALERAQQQRYNTHEVENNKVE